MFRHAFGAIALAVIATGAQAQTTPAGTVQRDINQQTRIERGLQDGSLDTREAGQLEKEQSRLNRQQARALKDGTVTPAEQARLDASQNKVSRDIATARHNGVNGNPLSGSSQRMQADVQRDINQQQRIENGVRDGSLTRREAGKLERGQARTEHAEAVAARDGHVGAAEQRAVQRKENQQSRRIHRERHDGQHRAS